MRVFFIHIVIAGTPLRNVVVRTIGVRAYRGLFALASLAGVIWIVLAYKPAVAEDQILWAGPRGLMDSAIIIMFFVFFLVVPGLLTPNPTFVSMETMLNSEVPVNGMLRITRHPFLWGVTIWGILHFSMTGHSAAAFLSAPSPSSRCSARSPSTASVRTISANTGAAFAMPPRTYPSRRSFRAATSCGWAKWAGGAGWRRSSLFGVVLYAHQWLFGYSPLPGGMSFY